MRMKLENRLNQWRKAITSCQALGSHAMAETDYQLYRKTTILDANIGAGGYP
jgi:hypothetical protein